MSFNILDYIKELEKYGEVTEKNTWLQATCPVCRGKLKISRSSKYGSYACYSDECHKKEGNLIYRLLYRKTAFNQPTAFTYSQPKRELVELVKPLRFEANTVDFFSTQTYIPPTQENHFTYFQYDSFVMVRLDLPGKDKYMYPEYLDTSTGEYVKGIPQLENIPVYQNKYIQENLFILEGEKTTDAAYRLGLAAITLPTFAQTPTYLARIFKELKRKKVRNICLLPDNDAVGLRKAIELEKYCWKYGIATKQYRLTNYFTSFSNWKGFDLANCLELGLIDESNVFEVMDKVLC